jgi:hypothetical protein
VVKKEERLPEWVMNLSGDAQQMNAVEEDGDKYLVGPLCQSQASCTSERLIVAVSFDKKEAYAMLVEVPAGLPADKSPTRHANYRFLGEPDQGMQDLLMEQLKKIQSGTDLKTRKRRTASLPLRHLRKAGA